MFAQASCNETTKFSRRELLKTNQAAVSSTINEQSEESGHEFLKPEIDDSLDITRTVWFINSGASAHLTHDKHLFSSLCEVIPFPVQMCDNSELIVRGKDVLDHKRKANGAWKY